MSTNKTARVGVGERPTSNVQRPTSNVAGARPNVVYDLEERLLAYAVRVIRLVEELPKNRAGNYVGDQLLRSGTSPTLNHGEVQAAESPKDFVHKLGICQKELRESRRALRVVAGVPLLSDLTEAHALICEAEELIRIFFVSVRTAKKRIKQLAPAYTHEHADAPILREDSAHDHWTLDVERWTLDVLTESLEIRNSP